MPPVFPPMLGFADPARPDWGALVPYCAPGEPLYCGGWPGPAPTGWRIEAESTMFQMVWQRGETPFLHVMRDNVGAHGPYARMGSRDNRESTVRVVVPG